MSNDEDEIIVHADEVDDEGTDVSTLTAATDAELTSQVEERSQHQTDLSLSGAGERTQSPPTGAVRPILRREGSIPPPPPPKQPPPPAPDAGSADNSLSLAQLRHIVSNFSKPEPTAYAYSHGDTRTFAEELEEWFQYTQDQRNELRGMRAAFKEEVRRGPGFPADEPWNEWSEEQRQFFWSVLKAKIGDAKPQTSLKALKTFAYVVLGCWQSSGSKDVEPDDEADQADLQAPNEGFLKSFPHIRAMRSTALDLVQNDALDVVFQSLKLACDDGYREENLEQSDSADDVAFWNSTWDKRVNVLLTILYVFVEVGRWEVSRRHEKTIRDAFIALKPGFLGFLSQQIARIRWDDSHDLPLTRAILLLWKGMLLVFGDSEQLEKHKGVLLGREKNNKGEDEKSGLTTNPLDYHLFRQEIISKYPSYNPPPPLLPLEPENTSYLPPIPRSSRSSSITSMNIAPAKLNKSIFEQPVHITTPVPSPPPSPAGPGGKGGKKQNYQTNQNFPFLYPPLDSSSNDLGGKGGVALQDRLVGTKWEGGDVPRSILEAGELFASRMKIARWTRQLWEAREACVKHERGWNGIGGTSDDDTDEDVQEFKLDGDLLDHKLSHKSVSKTNKVARKQPTPSKETKDPAVQQRLDMLDDLYKVVLPHLQSIVIIVLKVLLSNISATGGNGGSNQGSPQLGQDPFNADFEESQLPRLDINLAKSLSANVNGHQPQMDDEVEKQLETLNATRTREITSKGIAGLLLSFLKWFRFSHILKFEFLTELLLDSNYLPLALKYFALQDVDRAVDRSVDSERLGFFRFCQLEAGVYVEPPKSEPPRPASPESSEDEAQPPPIRRARTPSPNLSPSASPRSSPSPPRKPEVDELGYPTNPLPQQPLTTYSARFFFTTISMLRILQKITKNHAHRALLLVQYKSSVILRKALKVPQPALRLYTLKLFKSQVPYCGRKWRQANMRVITAIYVYCRMGLRDDWISGSSAVDEWVDGALGQEQAWRGLVGWWHSRSYRDSVGLDNMVQEDEEDFFSREMERMGWGVQGLDGMEEEADADGPKGQEWDQGQPENWG